jgi:hypothetical protein
LRWIADFQSTPGIAKHKNTLRVGLSKRQWLSINSSSASDIALAAARISHK